MKQKIDGILVVEGKSDVAFLSNYFDVEFVTTNGSEIPEETIDYLKQKSSSTNIYILTDPDAPGKRIRDVLDSHIAGLKHCFVTKEKSIKKNKVGVAEGDIEEIKEALKNYIGKKEPEDLKIKTENLVELGLTGDEQASKKRYELSKKLKIGFCNTKTFLKRVNSLGLSVEDLKNML